MTCRSLPPLNEDAIVEVARGREVGRGTAAAVEAHVEHCAACAARLRRERQLSEGLRALALATASAAPPPAFEAMEQQLRAAFAAAQPRPSVWSWKTAAAAAALVAATGWWWTARDTAVAPKPDLSAAATPPAVSAPPPATVAPARNDAPREDASRTVRRDRPARAAPRRPAPAEGEFVALPAAVGLPDFESGVIVRMEMPAAALPSYGIEIVPDAKAPVEADLLIGQDGQARAIRLVRRATTRSGAEQ